MTLLFAADLHGSSHYTGLLLDAFNTLNADCLVLLGDLLYGGGWNPATGYESRETGRMLNRYADRIVAIQGNCDCEADANALTFPLAPDFATLLLDGRRWFLTHGHRYGPDRLPPLQAGDVLVYGHTHVAQAVKHKGLYLLNPGSLALPKRQTPHSYGVYQDHRFRICGTDGDTLHEIEITAATS